MKELYSGKGEKTQFLTYDGLDDIGQELLKTARETVLALNKTHRCTNFIYFTDPHLSAEDQLYQTDTITAEPSLKMVASLAKERWADAVFCGGDVINAYNSDFSMALERFSELADLLKDVNIPVYFCKGNHDDNMKVSADHRLTNGIWSAITKPWQKGAEYNPEHMDGGYFYVDLPNDVRVFVWNQFDSDSSWNDTNPGTTAVQSGWFREKLSDNKTLVTMLHNPESGATSSHSMAEEYADSACVINAHTHADALTEGTVPKFTVGRSFAVTKVTNLSHTVDEGANKYCVSIFSIDTVNKIVYETRIGRGESRQATYGATE